MQSFSSLIRFASICCINSRVLIDTGVYIGKFLIFAVPYTMFATKINGLKYSECRWVTDKDFDILKGPKPEAFIDVEYTEENDDVRSKLECKSYKQEKIEYNEVTSFINKNGQMFKDTDFWL